MSGKIFEYNNKNITNFKRRSIVKVRKEQDLTPIEILHAGTGLKITFEQLPNMLTSQANFSSVTTHF